VAVAVRQGQVREQVEILPWSSRDPVGTASRVDHCGRTGK